MEKLVLLSIAFIIDLLIGDPYKLPHPVRFIGYTVKKIQKIVRRICVTEKQLKVGGFFLLLFAVTINCGLVIAILLISKMIHAYLYYVAYIAFSYYFIASTCLAKEANNVKAALKVGLTQGRKQVGYIVGRDTMLLSEKEIIKATIETVAENTTDGIISPIIYLFIGGPVLACLFKVTSTLDSMVGYQNDKYKDIGYFSAKFDDLLNYIPARITGLLFVISAFILSLNYKQAFKILKRDRRNHKSPNCAYAEAPCAGALEIQLGGTHKYFGETVYKPTIGDEIKQVEINDISKMNRLMYSTAIIGFFLCGVIYFIVF